MPPHAVRRSRRTLRRGFTLSELLLTMTLTIMVFATAIPFVILQVRQLTQDLGRSDAQMTARFAQNTVDRELRNIGIGTQEANPAGGVPRAQPKIVQAHPFAVTFNTNLASSDTGDVEAVYYDPNIPPALTVGMTIGSRITLPHSSKLYPDHTYLDPQSGTLTLAETVSYWATLDSTSSANDEYVLFRRINDGPISVVAEGIRVPTGGALFRFTRVTASGALVTVPTASLPIFWDQNASIADSIRSVDLTIQGLFKGYDLNHKAKTWSRTVNAQTYLANIGLAQRNSCGDVPLDPGPPTATAMSNASGLRWVRLQWAASPEETGGEKDVDRYVVFRREAGLAFQQPLATVGKGSSTYIWDDFDLVPGTSFEYGVASQDCSPANSAVLVSAAVLHP